MKVLVTGASGLLGGALAREARGRGHEVLAPDREELDVTDPEGVEEAVRGFGEKRDGPLVILNCAAFSQVDRAQAEPEEALAVNRDGAANVAGAAARAGAFLLHVSTDYVFDGKKEEPYLPTDQPAPLNLYGISKLAGELAVRAAGGQHLILRTSWLFGHTDAGFVAFLRRAFSEPASTGPLRVVKDETSRPTYVEDLAPALLDLVEARTASAPSSDPESHPAVLHLANRGSCTRLELAQAVQEELRGTVDLGPGEEGSAEGDPLDREILPVTSEAFGAPARRPRYSVLDLTLAEEILGRSLPNWREALRRFLQGKEGPGAETTGPAEGGMKRA